MADAEKIPKLFKRLGDDERVEAKITLSGETIKRVVRKVESYKSWSWLQADWQARHLRVFSSQHKTRNVYASINPMSVGDCAVSSTREYGARRFGASCADGSLIVFRRVRERSVDGPTYVWEGQETAEQSLRIKQFVHESASSCFVFRLVNMREGGTWEEVEESETKFFVYVQTNMSSKATVVTRPCVQRSLHDGQSDGFGPGKRQAQVTDDKGNSLVDPEPQPSQTTGTKERRCDHCQ